MAQKFYLLQGTHRGSHFMVALTAEELGALASGQVPENLAERLRAQLQARKTAACPHCIHNGWYCKPPGESYSNWDDGF